MKTNVILLFLLLVVQAGQAQLFISPGAQVRILGDARLTLHNTSLVNHGSFLPGTGTVSFTGSNESYISGTQTSVFNKVEINKSNGGALVLQQPVNIVSNLRFIAGYLNLNGNILDLGATGMLIDENENSRITGAGSGHVLFSTTLNNPNQANPANLGLVISSGQNLGTVLIRRGHESQINNYGNGSSILRYYDMAPVNPVPFTATLRINYFDWELNGLTENNLVFWNSADNLHWSNLNFTSGNTNLNYLEKTGIGSNGRWTLSTSNNALPVLFSVFNLKCESGTVLLTWKTAQEQNSSHYQVEKNSNGSNWVVAGNVPAAGNSNTERSYSFTDPDPVENGYYRIAQYDMNGRVVYTNILRSACRDKNIFAVWPNPFTEKITIQLSSPGPSVATIQLFNSKGALVKKQQTALLTGVNQVPVLLMHLPAGAYHLVAEWGTNSRKALQVVKQ